MARISSHASYDWELSAPYFFSMAACCDSSATKPSVSQQGQPGSEPVGDAVVPEAVETLQRLVHRHEFIDLNAANLLNRGNMAFIERCNLIGDRITLVRQAD